MVWIGVATATAIGVVSCIHVSNRIGVAVVGCRGCGCEAPPLLVLLLFARLRLRKGLGIILKSSLLIAMITLWLCGFANNQLMADCGEKVVN